MNNTSKLKKDIKDESPSSFEHLEYMLTEVVVSHLNENRLAVNGINEILDNMLS